MLVGSADPAKLSKGAPQLADLATEPLELEAVETLQVLCEATTATVEAMLPPALHPTVPGLISWLVQRVPASPWGELHLAQTRLECRSGLRPRAFLLGAVVDNAAAAAALAARWGYRLRIGNVRLHRHYDEVRATTAVEATTCLELALRNPEPLASHDVQYVASLHLAETPRGLRLVQVDPQLRVDRAERGTPHVTAFEPEAWGAGRIAPRYPVSASFTVASVTLPKLRFLCQPDRLAFIGTERV